MRLPEDNDIRSPSVNILPMIDVIFAILAFFILATLYLTKAEGVPVNLPQAVTSTPQNQIDITLTITPDGSLFLGDNPVTLSDLADEVRRIQPAEPPTATSANSPAANIPADNIDATPILVTIRADETTEHGRVVAVMDQLRTVDRVRLGIATTQP
ncbi:MAG: biopolymer transporter ExbD [Phormidesmis sp. RL_2_1]|nr:biopolymer transporter ExbD [Phormidesmis sp. RL_2_1]